MYRVKGSGGNAFDSFRAEEVKDEDNTTGEPLRNLVTGNEVDSPPIFGPCC